VKRCEVKHESTSEAKHENKNDAANQETHHDMSFKHTQSISSRFSYAGSKTHPSDQHGHKTCTQKLPLSAWGFFSLFLSLG
jgi:hypothetical protein